jgi:alkyldihydroxyacetonephosphate synthase
VRSFYRREVVPAVLRLYDGAEAGHLGVSDGRALLLLGFQGEREMVSAQRRVTGSLCLNEGGEDFGSETGERWYARRFDASWLAAGNGDNRIADAIDVSAPWSCLQSVYEAVTEALRHQTEHLWTHFSHFYPQGGSIYFIVFLEGASREDVRDKHLNAWRVAMEETVRAGGVIAHHHGIGSVRTPWIAGELGSASDMLRSIKYALDPHGIFAPGRLGLEDG